MTRSFQPWDDLSDLENHYCHHHEMYHHESTGIAVCDICRDSKLAAYFRIKETRTRKQNER